jgi:hypothetical protein
VPFIELPRHYPPVGVLTLQGGVVAGCEGVVLAADGTYIVDSNLWFYDYRTTPSFGFLKKIRRTHLSGTTLSLLSLWAGSNYYHFVAESVPRIAIAEKAGISWRDVDHVLVPRAHGKSSIEVVSRLPLPQDKVRFVDFGEYVHCETLLATSFPGAPCVAPSWAASFLRSFGNAAERGTRRLYIRRHSARRGLTNEADIERMLTSRFGFEIFDYDTTPSELETMADAGLIVGAHGAGLTRMAFAPAGCAVVELLNPRWLYAFYWSLARASGHSYWPVIGNAIGRNTSGRKNPYCDFAVELASLTATVEAALTALETT